MKFAWQPEKERLNIAKHGIAFSDAIEVFRDAFRMERHDDDSSDDMEIVTYTLEDGKELTFEEKEAARIRIEAASKLPYVYDPDCPLLTPEQLAEFRPVNFATMEERAQAMREAAVCAS